MGHVRAALIFTGFLAGVLVAMPVLVGLKYLAPRGTPKFQTLFFKYHTALAGISCICHGRPYMPAKGQPGALLVANHVSYFDAAALGVCAPVAFVAKSEVARWPIFGMLAKLVGCVFVNRNIRSGAGRDAGQIQTRLNRGDSIVLFPEGTSSDGLRVLPFKSALFGAAESEGADFPIQPVSLSYTRVRGLPMDRRSRPFFAWYGDMDFIPHKWMAYARGSFEVVVRFHPPVKVTDFASRREMAAWCEEVVRRGLVHDRDGRAGEPELPPKRAVSHPAAEQTLAAE